MREYCGRTRARREADGMTQRLTAPSVGRSQFSPPPWRSTAAGVMFFRRLLFDLEDRCRLTRRLAAVLDLEGRTHHPASLVYFAEEHWRASAAFALMDDSNRTCRSCTPQAATARLPFGCGHGTSRVRSGVTRLGRVISARRAYRSARRDSGLNSHAQKTDGNIRFQGLLGPTILGEVTGCAMCQRPNQ